MNGTCIAKFKLEKYILSRHFLLNESLHSIGKQYAVARGVTRLILNLMKHCKVGNGNPRSVLVRQWWNQWMIISHGSFFHCKRKLQICYYILLRDRQGKVVSSTTEEIGILILACDIQKEDCTLFLFYEYDMCKYPRLKKWEMLLMILTLRAVTIYGVIGKCHMAHVQMMFG